MLSEALNVEVTTAIQAMISKSCIIDFGVIQKVVAKGVVSVAVSVASSHKDVRYITCPLINISSKSFTLDVEPNEGDKVIIFYPRKYSAKMFNKNSTDVIIDSQARGYNLMCGMAMLCNQYKTDTHNNIININNGELTLKLAYSEDDSANKVLLSINKDGELTYDSNENVSLSINKDGELNYDSNENVSLSINKDGEYELKCNSTSISIDSSNVITVDNGKAEVKVDSSGNVTIDAKGGKLNLKNNSTSLKDILSGMLQTLNTSLATAGSPASHTVVPQQFSQQTTQLNQLM